jgi:hypothetical protein
LRLKEREGNETSRCWCWCSIVRESAMRECGSVRGDVKKFVDLDEGSAPVYVSWAIARSWVWASPSRKDGGGYRCSAEMIGSSWGASICIRVCCFVSYLIPFSLPPPCPLKPPEHQRAPTRPIPPRPQQRPSRPQSAFSGTRAARSSEEESDGEDGVFALGMREEARCSGAR